MTQNKALYPDGTPKSENHGKRGEDNGPRAPQLYQEKRASDFNKSLRKTTGFSDTMMIARAVQVNELMLRAGVQMDEKGNFVLDEEGRPNIIDEDALQAASKGWNEIIKQVLPYTRKQQGKFMSNGDKVVAGRKSGGDDDDLEFDE